MFRNLMTCGAALMTLAISPAIADTLSTGTADGQVVLNVNGFGNMTSGGALYNPVGAGVSASTIYYSTLFYRIGNTGARADISTGTLVSFSGNNTTRTSVFTLAGLSVALTQSVTNLLDTNGVQTGSQLTQSYSFTNLSNSAISLDLARYIDGDLLFDGSLTDGGGRLTSNGAPLLFEIDSATGAGTSSTFLGLYNTGGTQNGYRIDNYSTLATFLANGQALDNAITNDANNDGFIDAGAGYDVALGLGSLFSIAAGGTGTLSTVTLFGSGAPGSVVTPSVPEPATWGMMILGFGLIGAAARRRAVKTTVSFA
jgi:hypothetical protein